MQLAPWRHGLLAHSLMSSSQKGPWKPGRQLQKAVLTPSVQEPPLWHGSGRGQKAGLRVADAGGPHSPTRSPAPGRGAGTERAGLKADGAGLSTPLLAWRLWTTRLVSRVGGEPCSSVGHSKDR